MPKQLLNINKFYGGIAQDEKIGIPNSYLFSRNIDIFADASYLTLNPRTVKMSGATVTSLVLWAVDGSPYNDSRYFYDLAGNIYRESSSDVWSNLRTVSGSAGNGLGILDDYLYYAGATTLGRYGRLTGTPAFSDNFLADGITNLDDSQALTGNTYTTPVAISETATNRQTFTPTRDPVASFQVYVVAKGTGNWTITLHDSENNVLSTATVNNASLTNGALNTFTLADPARVVIGNDYHFHVTSTVNDGTLRTGTASDLETSTFNEFFGILIDTDYHPIAPLLNGIVIGNDNYLAFWDQANYNPNQVTLEYGFQVRTLGRQDEFIVAGAWKGDDLSNIEDARLYFWDGISPTFNYSIPVSMGLPNALTSNDNTLLGVYGSQGSIYSNTAPFNLLHDAVNLANNKTIEVAPGAITPFQNKTAVGYSLATDDNSSFQKGVYVWGNKADQFPEVLNFSYTVSSGSVQGANLKIGMVQQLGNDLYVGVREGSDYWVDRVSPDNSPFTTGEWYTLIFDNELPSKPKYADMLVLKFEPLVSGETFTPKYALDANAYSRTFTTGDTVSTVGATEAVLPIGKRYKDISIGFNIASSTTFPKLTGVIFIFDDLAGERDWGQI